MEQWEGRYFIAQILVFVDSVTYVACDRNGGLVQRLRKFLDEKSLSEKDFYYLVYNLGVSGNTAEDLLGRFEFEAKQRLKEDKETTFIFAIGLNDSKFMHSKNRSRFSCQEFHDNLQKLLKIAQGFSSKIIFVGLTPVDESKVNPMPWAIDESYRNEHIQKFNEVIKSICKEKGIYFIEIFEKFTGMDYKRLLEDGLHLNSEGHQKSFEIVKDFLIENKDSLLGVKI